MKKRLDRLGKLADLQRMLKDFHETRNGMLLADAARARREAQEIASLSASGSPLSAIFPEVYASRITQAEARENDSRGQAEIEARRATMAGVRLQRIEQAAREIDRALERAELERDALERAGRVRDLPR